MKKCDIIIPVWNELNSTKECIKRIKAYTHYPYRLIVVDNGSEATVAGYLDSLKKDFKDFTLIRNAENLGFVKAINQGVKLSDAEYVCVLNNDAYVTDNWLSSLVDTIELGPIEIGLANPASNIFGMNSTDGKRGEYQELDTSRGFCMVIKKEIFNIIGYFDEVYGMGYFEEKDFSMRAKKAGYISIRAKSSFVFHRDKLSFDKIKERDAIFKKNEDIYNKRWGRPVNIAFVPDLNTDVEKVKTPIYKLLDKGHRILIFSRKNYYPKDLKDHINIKYFPLKSPFFGYTMLFKLWERRRKKKIEIIVCNEKNIQTFFERFKFIHGAQIEKEIETLEV